ncbi:MAG TPA: ABC transporter permease [Bryobacteraceae bacterium]|nr:ABC transporter permease [Bryobacteraceae bacterium]
MKTLGRNLRHSIRILAKSKGFTLVTILTLALGIGANTAIFSVVYAALLRPLPYLQPSQLVTLAESRLQYDVKAANSSYPDYLDWKGTAKGFQSLAAYSGDAFTLLADGDPRNTFAGQVTPGFFGTLGVKPALGRDFVEADQQRDYPRVAMLGDKLWRSQFHADPNVVGRVIHLDGKPVTIVGVLPRAFEFAPAGYAELWVPLHPAVDAATRRSLRWLHVVARLGDGVTADQALAEMKGITAQLARAYPNENGSTFIIMGSLREKIVGKIQPLLLVLLGAVGFVLLITCANVANLLITRSIGRRKEFAVRAALGASRGNLLSQLLTESLLLSSLGACAGLITAAVGIDLLVSAIPKSQLQSMPFLLDAGINIPVLAFLCGVTLLTGILFGLGPGLTVSQLTLNDALKDETRGGTSSAHARLRNSLVIVEIAVSLVLMVGAGLMLKSLRALLGQDPGFDLNHVLTFDVNLPDASYPSEKAYPFNSPSAIRFEHSFTERLGSLPGVIAVASASGIPADGGAGSIRFVEEGRPVATGHEDEANILTVTTSYFSTLRIPLVAGRFFAEQDGMNAPNVLIVNRAFVKSYFPNEDPIGKRIRFTFNAKEPLRQIVGVVADTAENDLAEAHPPIVYYPNDQGPSTYLRYLVRTAGEPVALVSAARSALHRMDPQLPMIQPATLQQVAGQSQSVFLRRYPSYLIGSFAGLALILAMVGLYGLISYTIVQRTREIGIRVTLGAQRHDVLRLIVRQGLGATLAGIGIGIVAGLAVTQLLRTLLFGVTPGDWPTFVAVAALLLVVALAACVFPARRAMRIDPLTALRHE